jgi:hypothetical protein
VPNPRPLFDKAHTLLIHARLAIMGRDPGLGETLCRYTFDEGERVKTLARDRDKIVYSRSFVMGATHDELVEMLKGIARRAA